MIGQTTSRSKSQISPEVGPRNKKKIPYRFEDMWLTSPECENVVKEAWDDPVSAVLGEDVN